MSDRAIPRSNVLGQVASVLTPLGSPMQWALLGLAVALFLGWSSGYFWLLLFACVLVFSLSAAVLLAVSLNAAGGSHKARRPAFWVTIAVGGMLSLLMATLMPPIQSPDEHVHLWRAYSLLDNEILAGHGTVDRPENKDVDSGLKEYGDMWLGELAFQPWNQATSEVQDHGRSIRWSDNELAVFNPAATYFPALYAPAAAALAVARELRQPVWVSVAWARLAMWFVGTLLIVLALSCARAGFHTMCVVVLIPMTLAQVGSANLDAITIPLALLLVAMMTCGVFGGTAAAPVASHWAVRTGAWLMLAALILAKPIFLVFLAVPGYWVLRGQWSPHAIAICVVLCLVAIWQFHVSQNFVEARVSGTGSAFGRLVAAIASPIESAQLILKTLQSDFGANGKSLSGAGFYWRSMIGILGWLDTPLPRVVYHAAAALLAIAVVADATSTTNVRGAERLLYPVMAVALFVGTMLLLWVSWTPAAHTRIEGVQGRYFLPAIPLIAMGLGLRNRGQDRGIQSWVFFAALVLYVIILGIELPGTLLNRYWL